MGTLKLKNHMPPPPPSPSPEPKIETEVTQTEINLPTTEVSTSSQTAPKTQPSKKNLFSELSAIWNKKANYFVGVDVGNMALKVVILQRKGNEFVLYKTSEFTLDNEGITDESEIYQVVNQHVTELLDGHNDYQICLGIPQFFGTVLIKDFPPGITEKTTKMMIQNEIHQLNDLTDYSFIYDWKQLEPNSFRKNPFFIAICREETTCDFYNTFKQHKLPINNMTFNGLGDINALLTIHPEIKNDDKIQILMDIGANNIIIALLHKGNIYSLNNLSYGAEILTGAIQQQFGITRSNAEKTKLEGRYVLDYRFETAFLRERAKTFVADIHAAIDEWKQTAELSDDFNPETDAAIGKIWLCGGGVSLEGFDSYIEKTTSIPTEIFGPDNNPKFSCAYGLAYCAAQQGAYAISFLPPAVVAENKIKTNAPWMFGGIAAVAAVGFSLLAISIGNYHGELQILRSEYDRLSALTGEVRTINNQQRAMLKNDLQSIPYVMYGNVSTRIRNLWEIISGQTPDNQSFINGFDTWPIYWQTEVPSPELFAKNHDDSEQNTVSGLFKSENKKQNNRPVPISSLLGNTRYSQDNEKDPFPKIEVYRLTDSMPVYMILATTTQLKEGKLASDLKHFPLISGADRPSSGNEILEINDQLHSKWRRKLYNKIKSSSINTLPVAITFESMFVAPKKEDKNQKKSTTKGR